jgi:ribosomal protein S18 acetylase RimI-like enzyme
MIVTVDLLVRPALPKDQKQIANLLYFEAHVHRHLDWRAPLDWLGAPFYWVAESAGRVLAALACPKDPPQVAWLRLFTHAGSVPLEEAWDVLWQTARAELEQHGPATVAVIALHEWMEGILLDSGFNNGQSITMLEWRAGTLPQRKAHYPVKIRPIKSDDLPAVARLDAASFDPIWQNSLSALERAFDQASLATLAEDERGLLGYQISTQNPFGAHLARLAVRPDIQREGVGTALLNDLLTQITRRGLVRLTVNTQSQNLASLSLYEKMGFRPTGENYPVYQYPIG